jgi:hypothetical protein
VVYGKPMSTRYGGVASAMPVIDESCGESTVKPTWWCK